MSGSFSKFLSESYCGRGQPCLAFASAVKNVLINPSLHQVALTRLSSNLLLEGGRKDGSRPEQ